MGRNVRKSITQKLRDIEMEYSMNPTHQNTLRQARQLIMDLWELHATPDEDLSDDAAKLFEDAGLKLRG